MNNIIWLQDFFQSVCDGDWEHSHGIVIETLDNPGWKIDIHLTYTPYEYTNFRLIDEDKGDTDWIVSMKEDGVFKVRCSVGNLGKAFEYIREQFTNHK